jgi:sugar lactone lactonase YvrE
VKRALLVSVLTLCAAPVAASPVADRVYGQPTFTSNLYANASMPPDSRIAMTHGVAVNALGVYISDEHLSRVLFFPNASTRASMVIGQPDFNTTIYNAHGLNAYGMARPWNIDASAAGLAVADWRNSRGLVFPLGEKTANLVLGQPNFGASTPTYNGMSPTSIAYPDGIAIDNEGGVYLSDSFRYRVVYYPPGSNYATKVWGAPDLWSASSGVSPDRFWSTHGLAVDGKGLYVCDSLNNRVLFFPHGSSTATRVYGQPGFYSSTANNGGIGPNTLNNPMEVAADDSGVFIADTGNSRVLYYPGESTIATVVYGQPDFINNTFNTGGLGPSSLASPSSVATDGFGVYVADMYNCRVLRFPHPDATRPNAVEFAVQPAGGTAGKPLQPSPVVHVKRADGSLAENYNGPVTLVRVPEVGPPCGQLYGNVTVNAVNGVAVFDNVRLDAPGAYALRATLATVNTHDTEPFVVEPPQMGAGPADADRDGNVTILDGVVLLRVLYGLDRLPVG